MTAPTPPEEREAQNLLAWIVDQATASRWSTFGTAATRIAMGLTVLTQLVAGFADRQFIWGPGQRWARDVHDRFAVAEWLPWLPDGPAWLTTIVVLAAMACAIAVILGWHSRVTCALLLVTWLVLMEASPHLRSGAGDVVRLVLLYLCLTDSGAVASLDARRRRRAPARAAGWLTTVLHNVGVVLIGHQVVMIYVSAALFKFEGQAWIDGTAVYGPLNVGQYSPWLDELGWLYSWPPFIHVATWSAMLIQLAFPLLLLDRRTRIIGFVLVTGTHIAIGVMMGLMYFSLAMIAADAVLVSDASWRNAARTFRRWRSPASRTASSSL